MLTKVGNYTYKAMEKDYEIHKKGNNVYKVGIR